MRKLLLALTLSAGATAAVPAAHADSVRVTGALRILATHSLQCLDVAGASLDDGAPVVQYTCHLGHHQQWEPWPLGLDYFQIQSVNSGKCLAVTDASLAHGARLVQQACDGGPSQQWAIATGPRGLKLANCNSTQCADVEGASTAPGAALLQWTCEDSRAQDFLLAPAPGLTTG